MNDSQDDAEDEEKKREVSGPGREGRKRIQGEQQEQSFRSGPATSCCMSSSRDTTPGPTNLRPGQGVKG